VRGNHTAHSQTTGRISATTAKEKNMFRNLFVSAVAAFIAAIVLSSTLFPGTASAWPWSKKNEVVVIVNTPPDTVYKDQTGRVIKRVSSRKSSLNLDNLPDIVDPMEQIHSGYREEAGGIGGSVGLVADKKGLQGVALGVTFGKYRFGSTSTVNSNVPGGVYTTTGGYYNGYPGYGVGHYGAANYGTPVPITFTSRQKATTNVTIFRDGQPVVKVCVLGFGSRQTVFLPPGNYRFVQDGTGGSPYDVFPATPAVVNVEIYGAPNAW